MIIESNCLIDEGTMWRANDDVRNGEDKGKM